MIVINRNIETNKIALSLREYQSEETNSFLFVFTNDFTNETITVNLQDVSPVKERSNIFCVPGSLFEFLGFYHYKVYQNPEEAEEFTDLQCVEVGKLKVIQNESPTKAFITDRTTNKVYSNG